MMERGASHFRAEPAPRPKSAEKVGNHLAPRSVGLASGVRDRLNQTPRGWSAYFSYGTLSYNYVYEGSSRGFATFTCTLVRECTVKPVVKPMPEIAPH